jgi:YHS domain-containing protein
MGSGQAMPLPVIGSDITTACGTPEKYTPDTPRAFYQGRWIYFCTPSCVQDFVQDPQNSCLPTPLPEELE